MALESAPPLRDLTTDALQYWERRRVFYNALLAVIVAAHFAAAWPHSQASLTLDATLGLFVLAVLANVAYSTVYVADVRSGDGPCSPWALPSRLSSPISSRAECSPGVARPELTERAVVERLWRSPVQDRGALIAESEAAGQRFVRRLADEWTSGINRYERPGEALFVARLAGEIVGVGGLNVDPYASDATVGRVRHLYVGLAHRRRGVGRQLMAAIIGAAQGRFGRLRPRTHNPAAAALYEQLGFHRRGDVPGCTHVMELA
jgi:GNAT superfamily N-acetyltransferase